MARGKEKIGTDSVSFGGGTATTRPPSFTDLLKPRKMRNELVDSVVVQLKDEPEIAKWLQGMSGKYTVSKQAIIKALIMTEMKRGW